MSGGHYDYQFIRVRQLGDYIERDVAYYGEEREEDGEKYPPLSTEQLDAMKDLAQALHKISKLCKSLEWAMSGDTGMEQFMRDYYEWKSTCLT